MARDLTASMEAAVAADVIRPFLACYLDFEGDATRVNTTPIDIVIDGEVYYGIGDLGSVGAVVESSDIQANTLEAGLNGLNPALIALAIGSNYQGRAAIWYLGLLDENHVVIDAPIIIFRGRMDIMPIELGDTAAISVQMQNRLADWDRPRGGRYTHEEQLRRYPDDLGLEYVSKTVEAQLVWGSNPTTQPIVMQASGGGGKK